MMKNAPIPPIEDDIVFVCGALRSGTTLLRLMIDSHPALSNPGEMDFLFEPPSASNGAVDMDAYAEALSTNRVFNSLGLKFRDGLSYEDQVRDFVRQFRVPGKRLTVNIHRHFDRIPAIFPNARYVHLLRDPRDAANSAIGMGWAGNVFHGVDHWINSERDFDRLAAKVDTGSIFTLKNEDLVRNVQEELGRLCEFLGVGYDAAMLDYPSRSTYGAPDPKLVEQWRRRMSEREIALIEGKTAAMQAARGYELSGIAPITPSALGRLFIRLDNSWRRWRFARNRYGALLAILDPLSRLAPIPGAKGFVRRKKAAADAGHLK